jgi:hypothetical protein
MNYGLLQYYNDELLCWRRTLELYSKESGEILRIITISVDTFSSLLNKKTGQDYVDMFLAIETQYEFLTSKIIRQQERLERIDWFAASSVEQSICHLQDSLRTRIYNAERKYIRMKYASSIFLSTFFNNTLHESTEGGTRTRMSCDTRP